MRPQSAYAAAAAAYGAPTSAKPSRRSSPDSLPKRFIAAIYSFTDTWMPQEVLDFLHEMDRLENEDEVNVDLDNLGQYLV